MGAKRLFESIRSYFSGGNKLPWWCDRDIFEDCEEGVADAKSRINKDFHMCFISTFALSKKPRLNVWISIFEEGKHNCMTPLQRRDHSYLLAIGYYRNGNYERSMQLLEHCLEMELLEQMEYLASELPQLLWDSYFVEFLLLFFARDESLYKLDVAVSLS